VGAAAKADRSRIHFPAARVDDGRPLTHGSDQTPAVGRLVAGWSSAPTATLTPAVAPAVVLTIAGSEATGGAGAQADLKTFQELGVFGIANLTCIVSFDPKDSWNHRFVPVDQQVIADQLEATTAAYGAVAGAPYVPGRPVLDTVKIGMLGSLRPSARWRLPCRQAGSATSCWTLC
jgi:hypothetical protein